MGRCAREQIGLFGLTSLNKRGQHRGNQSLQETRINTYCLIQITHWNKHSEDFTSGANNGQTSSAF